MSSQRDGFTFYKSYYDVFKELNDKDKVQFIEALLDKQFIGKEPTDLKGMANFAYLSQKHSIDKQVKGWEDKKGMKLTPLPRVAERVELSPYQQEEEKGKEQEQVQEQHKEKGKGEKKDAKATELDFSMFDNSLIEILWKDWKEYKWNQHKEKFKAVITEQVAINKLAELSNNRSDTAKKIIEQSISNLWKGLFELKINNQNQNNGNNGNNTYSKPTIEDRSIATIERLNRERQELINSAGYIP
jgi:hypothetical protein